MPLRLGIDVGGTNLRCGVFEHAGQPIWQSRHPSGFSGLCEAVSARQALARVEESLGLAIATALAEQPEVRAVGIGFPGFIDPVTHMLSLSPNLPGLRNVDLASPLA
ncbi:MAG: ROK family protein, partial [Betaproteobacteria bacterium]|nr:ROK family protein [Betaproteobacteria bacterium]